MIREDWLLSVLHIQFFVRFGLKKIFQDLNKIKIINIINASLWGLKKRRKPGDDEVPQRLIHS